MLNCPIDYPGQDLVDKSGWREVQTTKLIFTPKVSLEMSAQVTPCIDRTAEVTKREMQERGAEPRLKKHT